MESLTTIISILLPVFTGLSGWLAGKRKRNNDFIADLQGSIDLLSEKYTSTLKELVLMKEQNAELLMGQTLMAIQMKALRGENASLKKEVEELTLKLENVKIITRQAK